MSSSCCFRRPSASPEFEREQREAAEHSGLVTIAVLPTAHMGGVEPFGFVDGVSQPTFDWDRTRTPGTKADRTFTNLITLGEILLGYYNEYGFPAESPKLAPDEPNAALVARAAAGTRDLGRNGSYLVLRQLAQDVRGFWRWIAKEAARAGTDALSLAEAMVGRRIGGAPLAELETGLALPGVDPSERARNGFVFDADLDGLSCPIGAHIRRANPRTGDAPAGADGPIDNFLATVGLTTRRLRKPTSSTLPWDANTTVWPYIRKEDDAVASARFHRILRRGREYGRKIDREAALDPATPDPEAGLHFICLNANIARQFEFVQGAWLANSKFASLTGEQDPLLGNREPFPVPPVSGVPQRTDSFTPPRRRAEPPPRDRRAAVRLGQGRRLSLHAGARGAEMDREPLRRAIPPAPPPGAPPAPDRRPHRPSARHARPHSSSAGRRRACRTCVCAPGFGCRAGDGPAGSATG